MLIQWRFQTSFFPDPDYQDVIGQREGFSDTDVGKLMAKQYNC